MNGFSHPGPDSGVRAPLPRRMEDLARGEPASSGPVAMRARLCRVAAELLRTGGAGEAHPTGSERSWVVGEDMTEALIAWFGAELIVDREWILLALDRDLAEIDAWLAAQTNAVLHTPPFQRLEAGWRGVEMLTRAAERSPLAKIRVLNASWADVTRDLDRATDFDRSQLFAKIYTEEFGTLGGRPFGLLIGNYAVQHRPSADHPTDDVAAVKSLAMIAAAAFAPLVMGASPRLFQLESYAELGRPFNLRDAFLHGDYQRWHAMRELEETRFVGLAVPRVLMRLPYALDARRGEGFRFVEATSAPADYLWGNAAFSFGAVVLRAFANYKWFADIRGVVRDEVRGGLVTDASVASFSTDAPGVAVKPAMEAVLSPAQEKDLADMGFIALRKIPFTEHPAFYSNQSIHAPRRYDAPLANMNARLSVMLQYLLCVSRFAHYIKLLGRTFVGAAMTPDDVQAALQSWLMNYCSGGDDASLEVKARQPLRDASVAVRELPGRAGVYTCVLFLRPHFQLDDVSTGFRLVTQLSPSAVAA